MLIFLNNWRSTTHNWTAVPSIPSKNFSRLVCLFFLLHLFAAKLSCFSICSSYPFSSSLRNPACRLNQRFPK